MGDGAPNLTRFNCLHSIATPNYSVQQLFPKTKGNENIKATIHGIFMKPVNAGKNNLFVPVASSGFYLSRTDSGS